MDTSIIFFCFLLFLHTVFYPLSENFPSLQHHSLLRLVEMIKYLILILD